MMEGNKNKRNYTRLESVFPVDFTIFRLGEGLLNIDWQTAHTRNVSKKGMCLETDHLDESVISYMLRENIQLELRIKITPKPIRAIADVAWYQQVDDRFVLGLEFKTINKDDINVILRHAQWFRWASKAVIIISIFIFLGIVIKLVFER